VQRRPAFLQLPPGHRPAHGQAFRGHFLACSQVGQAPQRVTKGNFQEDVLNIVEPTNEIGLVSRDGSERTTSSLGIIRVECDGYWNEDHIFRFWEDAYGRAAQAEQLDIDAMRKDTYLIYALTPASSPNSVPVLRAIWIAGYGAVSWE
jgi:hypothetical protein